MVILIDIAVLLLALVVALAVILLPGSTREFVDL